MGRKLKKVAKTVKKVSKTVNKVANNPIVQAVAPVVAGPAGSTVLKSVSDYSARVEAVSGSLASGSKSASPKSASPISVGPSAPSSSLTTPQTASIRPQRGGFIDFLRALFGL